MALLSSATASARPPVVLVAFDEFPAISLLDSHGRIDAKRYPNFAALAGRGTWFPNATASVDETGRATEAMLTGSTPERRHPRTLAANPRNLFTLLGGPYGLNVSEEVTGICPRRYCPHVHVQGESEIKRELAFGRPDRFRRWVRSIRRHGKPFLHYKQVLLPHVPVRYLPSGARYSDSPHEAVPGIMETFDNRWLVEQAYQRHLLQLGFTDRLLGYLLRHLQETGLYDRALVVVTADNGESFGRFGNRHHISTRNAVDIAMTPLFIKRAGQRRGRIVRRHVRTVDILPSIAHEIGIPLRWRTEGRSVFGAPSRRIPSSTLMIQRSGHRFRIAFPTLRRLARTALRHKLRLFGSGDGRPGLFGGIGPHRALLGTPVSTWHTTAARKTRASMNHPDRLGRVRRSSGFLPVQISGRITRGARRGSRPLAFAVNGWITATAPTFHLRGSRSEFFSAMVPEAFLHDGRNRVEIYAITSESSGLRLVRVR